MVTQATKVNMSFGLEELFSPISVDHFLEKHWETNPFYLPRYQPGYFDTLFSVDKIDQILQLTRISYPDIRVVCEQVEMLPARYQKEDGSLHLNQLYKAYDEGHTIIINQLQRFCAPLAEFCNRLQYFLNHRVVANCYFSPAQSKALHPHYDTHDVFVLQLSGVKHWEVYNVAERVPLLNSFQPIIPENELRNRLGQPLQSVQMQAGDLMYIPRGFVHHAHTTETFSCHLTIGVYPVQWIDLISQALNALSLQDERFRRALPIGFFHSSDPEVLIVQLQELLSALADNANLQNTMSLLKHEFIHQTTLSPDGHFSQINALDSICPETVVEKRLGAICQIIDKGFSVSLQFPGNTINGPLTYQAAMEFVSKATAPFSVSQLPKLETENKITLVHRLVRGGLLKILDH